jgi:Protein of unknown function (DUF4238)
MAAKRHHAVPRFYLSRFAAEDGLIWLHDIHTQSSVRVSPNDAIVEKYLYAPEVGENPKDDVFEKFLADHVDGPAAPAIARLAEGGTISSEDRQRIAVFLAYQEFRIPRMRDAVSGLVTQVGERVLDLLVEHPENMKRTFEDMGTPMSDEDLGRLVEGVKSGGIKIEATKVAWLQSASIVTEIATMLDNMPWTVLEAPSGVEFLTSDSPIVKVVTDPTVPRHLAGGWLSPAAESTFALDPSHMLAIRPDGKEGRFGIRKAWCDDVNRRLISHARRFVVSRSPDSYVEIIAKKTRRRSH